MQVRDGDTKKKLGGAARRHEEVMMIAVEERREAAAHILAEGVVRLLATEHDDIKVVPFVDVEDGPRLGQAGRCVHLKVVNERREG
jgi:hypothetical protein